MASLKSIFSLIAVICLSTHVLGDAAAKNQNQQTTNQSPKLTGDKFYDVKTFTLENGLQVYLVKNQRTPAAGITVVYRVGSADDPKGKSGLAHFVEHMMFKGKKDSSPERLMREAEAVGGNVNATTSFDRTAYYEVVPKAFFEKFVKYEADRMRELEVRPEDVTPEINVVLEEENMRMGNNPFMQFMAAMRATYFRHHPYGTMPIGYRHEIKTYTPEDVKSFHHKHYGPNNAFVILNGDLTLDEAKILMTKYFGNIPKRGGWVKPSRERVVEPELSYSATIEKTSDRIANPYVFTYSKAPEVKPETYDLIEALELGFYALSNQITGILHRKLVEEKKVASFISIRLDETSLDAGKISIISQALDNVSLETLEKTLKDELKAILEKGLTEQQVEQFKQEILIQGDYVKDSLMAGATELIDPLITNLPLDRLEYWQVITKRLTAKDINEALRTYLQPVIFVKGYLKPDKSNPNKDKIAGKTDPRSLMNEAAHVR